MQYVLRMSDVESLRIMLCPSIAKVLAKMEPLSAYAYAA